MPSHATDDSRDETMIQLATAFCPDVPSSRESRVLKLHGVRQTPESPSKLGITLCGRLCNEPDLVPPDLVSRQSVCRICLRNPVFSRHFATFTALK
jgi:hypothetical protein